MPSEEGHVQITEYNKQIIPTLNYMMEDLYCQYGLNMPYFLLDFDFPDYSQRPDWCSGYNFNLDWGKWGYNLPWFNNLLSLLFEEANLPSWQMPDFSFASWDMFNSQMSQLYENTSTVFYLTLYGVVGTFEVGETVQGQTTGATGTITAIHDTGFNQVVLTLSSVVGTFGDEINIETVTGQTSGAYGVTGGD